MLVDSHCHLNFEDFAGDFSQVLSRAKNSGVKLMQTICTNMQDARLLISLSENNESIYCSVGQHPLNTIPDNPLDLQELISLTQVSDKVIAVGEAGLDYHYNETNSAEHRLAQQIDFVTHIKAAQITGLPVVVHTRAAEDDTIRILQSEYKQKSFAAVMHCFTGSYELAQAMLDLGFYISASGIITFKNSGSLREVFAKVPLERLLIETDSPYLAPTPYRGKRNEPAYVVHVAECLAEIKNVTLNEIAKHTTDNFFKLFSRCKKVKNEL
jgi:TatD DNase family protein